MCSRLLPCTQGETRLSFALAVASATAFGLIVVTSYGNDGPLRTGLFALPWLAILAASAKPAKSHRLLTTAGVAVVLVVAIGYVLGTMAQDYVNAVRPSDLAAEKAFETSAPAGSTVFVIGDDYPAGLTSKLYELAWYRVLRLTKYRDAQGKFDAAGAVEAFNRTIGASARDTYVMTGGAPKLNLVSDGFSTTSEYEALVGPSRTRQNGDPFIGLASPDCTNYRLISISPTVGGHEVGLVPAGLALGASLRHPERRCSSMGARLSLVVTCRPKQVLAGGETRSQPSDG